MDDLLAFLYLIIYIGDMIYVGVMIGKPRGKSSKKEHPILCLEKMKLLLPLSYYLCKSLFKQVLETLEE